MKHILIFGSMMAAVSFAAPVHVQVTLYAGDKPLDFAQTYKTPSGQSYQLNLVKFFVSGVALVKEDGSELALKGLTLNTFKPEQSVSQVVFKGNAATGDYKGLRFTVGVPRADNHLDATVQKAPLGLDSGMYWAWNPGYIFYRNEGVVLTDNSKTPFVMHMGTDALALQVNLSDLQKNTVKMTVGKEGILIKVKLDVSKLFTQGVAGEAYDLSLPKYQQVHGGGVSTQAYLNLQSAFTLDSSEDSNMSMDHMNH